MSELRARLTKSMKEAMREKDAERLATLRLIMAAIKDRDIAARAEGNDDGVGSDYAADSWQHRANVAYFNDMLGSDALYWFTLQAAPADEIHVMTQQELARFGVLNAPARN